MTRDLAYYTSLDYPYQLERDPGGRIFAKHPDLPGCVADGHTADEAMANLDEARELWISVRLEDGLPVPAPRQEPAASGRVLLRMGRTLHSRLTRLAEQEAVSLNHLINSALSEYLGGRSLERQAESRPPALVGIDGQGDRPSGTGRH